MASVDDVSMQDGDAVELDWNDVDHAMADGGTLVGRVVTGKLLNRGTMRSLILRNWNTKGKVIINKVGDKLLLFNFECTNDLNRILRDNPRTVMGSLS